jgi:inward rectifier potassium channel
MAERRIGLGKPKQRLIKIRTRGQRVRLHEDFYHSVLLRPWWQFFLLVALLFLSANALFAAVYTFQPGSIANARDGSFEDAFFFSVQTFATIGYGAMAPATRFAHVIVTVEAICGILSGALITGLTFAKFARPTARVLFSEKVVIAPRNGVPYLQLRMANWRGNMVVEAQLRVYLLVEEITSEGETLRRPVELKLVRDRTALFVLSWTALHCIDESSPFYGEGALDRLRAQKAEIILSLSGLDETIGQTINARYSYTLDDIALNMRFADVMTVLPDGSRELDYAKFHDLKPL